MAFAGHWRARPTGSASTRRAAGTLPAGGGGQAAIADEACADGLAGIGEAFLEAVVARAEVHLDIARIGGGFYGFSEEDEAGE